VKVECEDIVVARGNRAVLRFETPLPPPQPRIIAADNYSEWSRCQACGSPSFSAFKGLGGKLIFACDGCVGEADRMMLGYRR
jgi:uncharacterized protein (DUF427 family)